jgi:hypothetical protein
VCSYRPAAGRGLHRAGVQEGTSAVRPSDRWAPVLHLRGRASAAGSGRPSRGGRAGAAEPGRPSRAAKPGLAAGPGRPGQGGRVRPAEPGPPPGQGGRIGRLGRPTVRCRRPMSPPWSSQPAPATTSGRGPVCRRPGEQSWSAQQSRPALSAVSATAPRQVHGHDQHSRVSSAYPRSRRPRHAKSTATATAAISTAESARSSRGLGGGAAPGPPLRSANADGRT